MRNEGRRRHNFILAILIASLAVGLPGSEMAGAIVAEATSISDLKNQLQQHQNQLEDINNRLSDLEDEQDLIAEEIDDLNAEIINTLTSIGLKEDEIVGKETEISD